MLFLGNMHIPMVSRTMPGMTLGSLWPSGVSALIARCASVPSTVQKSLGRKWDTKLKKSCSSEEFARDATVSEGYRSRQGHKGPRTGSIRTEKVRAPLTTKKFAPPIFQISHNSEKRCLHGQNRDFGSSEGDFDRKPAPQESESACIRSAR